MNHQNPSLKTVLARLPCVLLASGLLLAVPLRMVGQGLPVTGGGSTAAGIPALNEWTFSNPTNWASDRGTLPVTLGGLNYSHLGNGQSLVVDTNVAAWLQYNVKEANGSTNLNLSSGTVEFWFAPSWSSTGLGGNGAGNVGWLLNAEGWGVYADATGDHLVFTAQNGQSLLTASVSWTTNYFHFIALTYSATNTTLYVDGARVTNGLPLTAVSTATHFNLGSDATGTLQAHGLFNHLVTYAVPLDAATIQQQFSEQIRAYMINPGNRAMFGLASASANPVTAQTSTLAVITGVGHLQMVGNLTAVSDANHVWITNLTTQAASDGTLTATFAIQGGVDGANYDVFAGVMLTTPLGRGYWTWQGQGAHGKVYTLTKLPRGTVFLVLGTPQDSDGDGLTDAYEMLVSQTDPHNTDTDGDGLSDGWSVLLGINTLDPTLQTGLRANYFYTPADWLNTVSGVKVGAINLDNEGNVLSVSQ